MNRISKLALVLAAGFGGIPTATAQDVALARIIADGNSAAVFLRLRDGPPVSTIPQIIFYDALDTVTHTMTNVPVVATDGALVIAAPEKALPWTVAQKILSSTRAVIIIALRNPIEAGLFAAAYGVNPIEAIVPIDYFGYGGCPDCVFTFLSQCLAGLYHGTNLYNQPDDPNVVCVDPF